MISLETAGKSGHSEGEDIKKVVAVTRAQIFVVNFGAQVSAGHVEHQLERLEPEEVDEGHGTGVSEVVREDFGAVVDQQVKIVDQGSLEAARKQ